MGDACICKGAPVAVSGTWILEGCLPHQLIRMACCASADGAHKAVYVEHLLCFWEPAVAFVIIPQCKRWALGFQRASLLDTVTDVATTCCWGIKCVLYHSTGRGFLEAHAGFLWTSPHVSILLADLALNKNAVICYSLRVSRC